MTQTKPMTEGLPLCVRKSLAEMWILSVACERSLNGQPRDNIDHRLWQIDFISEDAADVGFDAFSTLDYDLAYWLIQQAADQTLICVDCLASLVWGEDEEEEEG